MSVIIEITKRVRIGDVLQTPSGRSRFEIHHINADRVVIRVGKKGTMVAIPSSCFEGAPDFLRGKGWVRIGATHGVAHEGTLDRYLQSLSHGTSVASYVASILERASIVEIARKRPAKIRLRASSTDYQRPKRQQPPR